MAKKDAQVEMYKEYFNELGIEFSEDIGTFDEDNSEYIKVDPSILGKVDAVMQNVPAVLLGANQADVYKVVYNKGLGVLQKAANNPGFYRGNVVQVGKNNVIKGGVLLQELSMGPQIVGGVFSVMSMVTGQYYMSQINDKLEKIEKSIEAVLEFLENDKRSAMESNEEFLKNIQYNHQSIMDNDDMRSASLGTIQNIKRDSLRNILFYKKQIGDLGYLDFKKDKLDDINNNISKTCHLISEYWYSLYLYCFASYLEPVIARNLDENYLEFITNDMRQKCEQYKIDYSHWEEILNKYIKEADAYDDNIVLGALKEINPNFVYNRVDPVFGAIELIAGIADKKDKKNKKKKRGQAYEILEAIIPHADIKVIESKQEDLRLYEMINSGRIELIKRHDEMYIKLSV